MTRSMRFFHKKEGYGSRNVVLLHGVGSNLDSWDFVVPALASDFTILRFDLRGHGQSDKPPGPYALRDFVDDTRALMLENSMSTASIAGISFGGMIAQDFAVSYPQMLDRLVVISAVAGRTPEVRARLKARADALETGG